MRESIFWASLRSFFVTFFGVAGVLISLFIVVLIIGAISSISSTTEPSITYNYSPEIVANADGVRKQQNGDAPVILKVNIDGVIGLDSLTGSAINQLLIESREQSLEKNRVKAILLCINTPGGTADDADTIYRLLMAYKATHKTPIYAYVNGLCASGGMFVAAAADKIYASDTSLIGSVGVLMPTTFNFTQLMEKIGVQSLTLTDGKGKDNLNPFRPWKKGEEDNIKAAIDYYYELFVDVVIANRKHMSKEKLVQDYGAQVYPPPLAKEYGYIDEIGANYGDTLKALLKEIDITDDYYQVIELKNSGWLSELFSGAQTLFTGTVKHEIALPNELSSALQNKYLYLYQQ